MSAPFQRLGEYDPAFTVDDSRQGSPVRAAPSVGGDKLGAQQSPQAQRSGYTGAAPSRASSNPLAAVVSNAGNQVRSALPASVLDQFECVPVIDHLDASRRSPQPNAN